MSRRKGRAFIIEPEPPRQCDDCSRIAELRPYGPGGSKICAGCSRKDPEGTRRRMIAHMYGKTADRSENGPTTP